MSELPQIVGELSSLPMNGLGAVMLGKLLGPTVEYLGQKSHALAQKSVENIEYIFQASIRKLGDKINEAGEVPPRVLRGIINEGQFCEDKIAAEYLGGVLASSRQDTSRDDRGVVMNAMISRLSVYQLRTHYIVYHALKDLYDGTGVDFDHPGFSVNIPFSSFLVSLGCHEHEWKVTESGEIMDYEKINPIVLHTFYGLHREKLIDGFNTNYGDQGDINVVPSVPGIELFLWAYGYGDMRLSSYLDPKVEFPVAEGVHLIPGYNPLVIEDEDGTTARLEGYTFGVPYSFSCPVPEIEKVA